MSLLERKPTYLLQTRTGLVKRYQTELANRIYIPHKDYVRKIRNNLQFMKGINEKILLNGLSNTLYELSLLGAEVSVSKDILKVKILDYVRKFSVGTDLYELKVKLDFVLRGLVYGFEVLPEDGTPLTSKYVLLGDSQVKLYNGIKFEYLASDAWIITETFFLDIHSKFDYGNKVVLDIGAAFGDTALFYAKQGASKILAVEPVNAELLNENLRINPEFAGKVRVLEFAAGSDGEINLPKNVSNYFDGNAGLPGHSFMSVKVKGKTIRRIIQDEGLSHVDILKADCKGCERLFTADDLKLIEEGVEIECTFNPRSLLSLLSGQKFKIELMHYDPTDKRSFLQGGMIIARR